MTSTKTSEQPGPTRSRPGGRSARVRAAVLAAARELVAEQGYEPVSIEQIAAPDVIYHYPASRFVAEFLGAAAFLPGVVTAEGIATELGLVAGVARATVAGGAVHVLVRPDDVTFAYVRDRPRAPRGMAWERARRAWSELRTDPGARYDLTVVIDAAALGPQVTWGTSPGMTADITERIPDPADAASEAERDSRRRALEYIPIGFLVGQAARAGGMRDQSLRIFFETEVRDGQSDELIAQSVSAATGGGVAPEAKVALKDTYPALDAWAKQVRERLDHARNQ